MHTFGFLSSRFQKCECISVFAHRELKSVNVLAFLPISCQSRNQKCECISVFFHWELKSVNVSAFSLIASYVKYGGEVAVQCPLAKAPSPPPLLTKREKANKKTLPKAFFPYILLITNRNDY